MPIRVVLVDDAAEVRRLVHSALRVRADFDVVGEAANGGEAVRLVARLQPDIVVLDLGLPDLAGREVLTRLRDQSPTSKVVVFSGPETPEHAWTEDRVDGVVSKDGNLDYLIHLLQTLGGGPERQAVLPLLDEPESVGRARSFVRGVLMSWGIAPLANDTLLVVSELVTNAVTHAQTACELRLSITDTTLRVEVVDQGSGTPDPRALSPDDDHGRGLYLVGALATAWGVQVTDDGGKLVWAELARPTASPAR